MKATKIAMVFLVAGIAAEMPFLAASAQGKTREEVRQELLKARHDGISPANKPQYPPTEDMLNRNRELHALTTHAGEKSPAFEQHDTVADR